jgi:hypothetical protein
MTLTSIRFQEVEVGSISPVRYTFRTVRKAPSLLLLLLVISLSAFAEETSFDRIRVPDSKGHSVKAVLTLSDQRQAVEIKPARGNTISIPYSAVDKFVYEYTRKHRVNEDTIATAAIGVGAVAMLTRSRNHWLEIDYHQDERPRIYVLRMDKRNYLQILDAVKKHTGKEPEILGNANKRKK